MAFQAYEKRTDEYKKGKTPGRRVPELQICPVIKKKTRQMRIGADIVTGPVTRIGMKGVQIAKRQRELSEGGGFAAPWKHWTINNYETTYNNIAVRQGDLTSDEVYELLMNHPARYDAKNRRNGRFMLKEYIPELSEEEQSQVSNSAMMPASSKPSQAMPPIVADGISEPVPVEPREVTDPAAIAVMEPAEEEGVLV